MEKSYWNIRYLNEDTPWTLNTHNNAIVNYFLDKDRYSNILIPGAGFSLEAQALLALGFKNITICDISEIVISKLKSDKELSSEIQFIQGDFFELEGQYDYIIEQTFFCAINPELREQYVTKMYDLLRPGGRLMGVLFNIYFEHAGPPFGGSEKEYKNLFSNRLNIINMEICQDSVSPRLGNELFFECSK